MVRLLLERTLLRHLIELFCCLCTLGIQKSKVWKEHGTFWPVSEFIDL